MNETKTMRIGPSYPSSYWEEHTPKGNCQNCGGECDGYDCGTHRMGCIYGGFGEGYWLIAEGCPLYHGE